MSGKLVVLEGLDGSGKSTQYELLCQRLETEGLDFRRVSFPRYDEDSSVMVRQYLQGRFGTNPGDVNPYAASTFYAVDRFASYKEDWGHYYEQGGFILAARYTTSNAAHQASKLDANERGTFFDWLYDFEFNLLGLPRPDMVLYLDVSVKASMQRMLVRQQETGTSGDIHETDMEYLMSSLAAGRAAARHYGWTKVACEIGDDMRSINDINDELYAHVMRLLRK